MKTISHQAVGAAHSRYSSMRRQRLPTRTARRQKQSPSRCPARSWAQPLQVLVHQGRLPPWREAAGRERGLLANASEMPRGAAETECTFPTLAPQDKKWGLG